MVNRTNRKQSRHLPAFLLLFLREEKLYGSQLIERLEGIMPKSMSIDGGSIYRVLRDLEKDGFVSSEWMSERGDHPIRVYEISDSGLLELERWYEDITGRKQMLEFFINTYKAKENG